MKRLILPLVAFVFCVGGPAANLAWGQRIRVDGPADTLIADMPLNHPLAGFIEQSTAAVAEINLTQINAEATAAMIGQFAGDDFALQAFIKYGVPDLRDAGVERLYLTFSTQIAVDQAPLVVIPHEQPFRLLPVAKKLLPMLQGRTNGNVVLLSSPKRFQRFAENQRVDGEQEPLMGETPSNRLRDLLTPLMDADRSDHTIVFSLPPESRRLLAEFWPGNMPPAFPIKGSPRRLAVDADRLVLGVNLPPEFNARFTLRASSDAAASRLERMLVDASAMLGPAKSLVPIERDGIVITIRVDPAAVGVLTEAAKAERLMQAQAGRTRRLKEMGLAIHNYLSDEGHLPPRCFTDRGGEPILSWRVAILPWIEQRALYNRFDLTQAWNKQEKQDLMVTVPVNYQSRTLEGVETTLRAPVYPGSLWSGNGPPRTLKDVTDGTSATIALIDAPTAAAVHWANPEPWEISDEDPMGDVFGDRDSVLVLMLDGAVQTLNRDKMTKQKLKAMLTIAGGEAIE